ncbi:cysteine-rich protein 2-binding protein, putative, partial [Ixodes scapularis]
SNLIGDLFFKLTCQDCSADNTETCERLKMQWIQVIMLTLYNLHMTGANGKLGYFRWREHICSFIDKHWTSFFGESRKRTATFRGTVAGALSSGCPLLFRSGTAELKENGWWTLTDMKPPSPADFEGASALLAKCRKARTSGSHEGPSVVDGPRKRHIGSTMQAAISLKEKRSLLKVRASCAKAPRFGKGRPITEDSASNCLMVRTVDAYCPVKVEKEEDEMLDLDEFTVEEPICDPSYFGVQSPKVEELVSGFLDGSGEFIVWGDLWHFLVCVRACSGDRLTRCNRVFHHGIFCYSLSTGLVAATEEVTAEDPPSSRGDESAATSVKEETETTSDCESISTEASQSRLQSSSKKRRLGDRGPAAEDNSDETAGPEKPRCIPMSIYEEHQLLTQLERYATQSTLPCDARRLRRKLLVRQIKRARNLPVFDLDAEVRRLCREPGDDQRQMVHFRRLPVTTGTNRHVPVPFQVTTGTAQSGVYGHVSFVTRILGLEEEQLDCIVSPYTQRTLKPFIFRDYETVPLRLKFLQEVLSHRLNKERAQSKRYPIDFCYVRPQHIPIVNAMCRTFFWPGIDLSESLQYPDFSCVAMYRKLVVGFAFMVPDVKYNEAYIPFIFTHPEWRRSGIAKFMLYHLIQTCMGKDVTLHVSATNSAALLYQKFGFKVEELILDFYDKYFPADSKECKHAMFLRLSR